MTKGQPVTTAFTYLYGAEAQEAINFEQLSGKLIKLVLPHPATKELEDYEIVFDCRDLRALLVVDGELLWQGMPIGADRAFVRAFKVTLPQRSLHPRRPFEEPMSESISFFRDKTELRLRRHFILMPMANMAFRRYDANGNACYVLAEVRRKKDGFPFVVWRNSSH